MPSYKLVIILTLLQGVLCSNRISQSTDAKGRWKVSLPTVHHRIKDEPVMQKAVIKESLSPAGTFKTRDKDDLVVETPDGKVLGMKTSKNGIDFYAFLGVPYATKPERFKDATPLIPWKGIINATKEPPNCLQMDHYFKVIQGSEDCLFANVATPTLEDKLLPVIVWVHGGMFKFGSGDFRRTNPNKLVAKGMVIVTFNYRLGVLGFLTTGTHHAPGNMGLKDTILLLKWVKRNVRSYGGDPNNLTMLGLSTGGVFIEMLTVSPMGKGLFNRAIVLSGSLMGSWTFSKNPVGHTYELAKQLNIMETDVDQVMERLSLMDPVQLVNASETYSRSKKILIRRMVFVPTVENKIDGEEAFFTEYPPNLLKAGKAADVPILMSTTDMEGLFYYEFVNDIENFIKPQDTLLETHMPIPLLEVVESKERWNEIVSKLRQLYFKGRPVDMETLKELAHVFGDIKFTCPIYTSVKIRQQLDRGRTYLMLFAHSNDQSKGTRTHLKNIKASGHAEDMNYIFTTELAEFHDQIDNETQLVTDRLLTAFYNFAKYGDPTPTKSELLPVKWPPLSKGNVQFMKMSEPMSVVDFPFKDRCEYWNEIHRKYLQPFYY